MEEKKCTRDRTRRLLVMPIIGQYDEEETEHFLSQQRYGKKGSATSGVGEINGLYLRARIKFTPHHKKL